MDIHSCSFTNTKWYFIVKVELACIEVGTDRGQDNAKGIAETILKHLEKINKNPSSQLDRFFQICLAQNLLFFFLQKNI
jgi:hypothetical protein